MVRFPSLYRRVVTVSQRLGPRSQLRRALLRRALVSGWAAFDRRDFQLMLVRYAPDVEYEFDPGEQTLGLGGTFKGHEGMLDGLGKAMEAWGASELKAACVVDLGDGVLALGSLTSRARASGIEVDQEFAQLVTVREGLIARDQHFFSWEEGLRASGLDPNDITLPHRKPGQAPSSAR